jgi:membrane protein DedA with SNARE-associated domain/rhodanese-related sulfurtransferase
MGDFIRELPQHGVLVVFVVVLLEQAGLPLPSFTVLVAAGALAATGTVSLSAAFAAAVVAALIANLAWYWAGVRYGQQVLRLLCRISLSPDTCVRVTESIFERWGTAALLLSKFLPGISLVAPPIAGAVQMPFRRFFGTIAAGTVLWTATHLALGYLLHEQLDAMFAYCRDHLRTALLTTLLLFALYLAYRALRRRLAAAERGVLRIEVAELRRLLADSARQPVVVDVRSALLREGRPGIPGALGLELHVLQRQPVPLLHEQEIVVYCACPNDVSAIMGARALRERGYRRVRALRGGLDAWLALGATPEPAAVPVIVEVAVRETA